MYQIKNVNRPPLRLQNSPQTTCKTEWHKLRKVRFLFVPTWQERKEVFNNVNVHIFEPKVSSTELRPAFIYMHGGGFTFGSSGRTSSDQERLFLDSLVFKLKISSSERVSHAGSCAVLRQIGGWNHHGSCCFLKTQVKPMTCNANHLE